MYDDAIVTAATGGLAFITNPTFYAPVPTIRRRRFFTEAVMSDALKRAQRYRYLAKECWRLAAVDGSPETQSHYRQMAEYYGELAEAEELSTLGHVNGD